MPLKYRRVVAFLLLFVLYQSAEGLGADWLHSFALQAMLMCACVVAAWPLGRWLGFRGYDAYALVRPGWFPWLLAGLLLAGFANLASMVVGLAMGIFAWQAGGLPEPVNLAPVALFMAALSSFVPSLAEDILTRGFWWRASGIRWQAPVFVAFSALLYTLNHVYRLGNGPTEWLMLLSFGIAYASAMLRSGSLWPAVGLHWGWNLSNTLFGDTLPIAVINHPQAQCLWAMMHLLIAVVVLTLPFVPAHTPHDPGGPGMRAVQRS